jgi:hypothetical protein
MLSRAAHGDGVRVCPIRALPFVADPDQRGQATRAAAVRQFNHAEAGSRAGGIVRVAGERRRPAQRWRLSRRNPAEPRNRPVSADGLLPRTGPPRLPPQRRPHAHPRAPTRTGTGWAARPPPRLSTRSSSTTSKPSSPTPQRPIPTATASRAERRPAAPVRREPVVKCRTRRCAAIGMSIAFRAAGVILIPRLTIGKFNYGRR